MQPGSVGQEPNPIWHRVSGRHHVRSQIMEGNRSYSSNIQLTDSDTLVRIRTSPTTNVLAFLRLGQGETDSGDALFCRQGTQVLGSHPSGNETESLGLGKGSRSEPGAELRLKIQLAVENRSTGFEVAGPQPDYRHQMSKCDKAREETCPHAKDPTAKDTRSNRDPCRDRAMADARH